MRRLGGIICIVVLLAAAASILALPFWHGPIVLSLSSTHGVDTGDLLAFPLIVVAIALARSQFGRRVPATGAPPWSKAGRASAIVLGALLLFAAVVSRDGGPLIPAGGGTLSGTIRQTFAAGAIPVARWSHIALTYDGAMERLYVDGRQVSSRRATGTVQTPPNPAWIGGNHPYGEYFNGLIDEVRIYDRALSPPEIRQAMSTPIRSTPGLVAAYAFDAGSGDKAADSSGNGNTGEIRGATWAQGRYGDALRFDGSASVVRVPPAASLNVRRAMTLSGWIRPSTRLSGWRTIVQRQTDAYFLTAGSRRQDPRGWIDGLRAPLLFAAALWFSIVFAAVKAPSSTNSWWVPVALFLVGSLIDAALAPSAALTGPTLVALWLAATASNAIERTGFLLAAAVCIGLTVASLADLAGVGAALSVYDGGIARSAALGALFVLGGLGWLAAPD